MYSTTYVLQYTFVLHTFMLYRTRHKVWLLSKEELAISDAASHLIRSDE